MVFEYADRTFDGACVCQHDLARALAVMHAGLQGRIKFAPCGAFAVEEGFPSHLRKPEIKRLGGDALFFEVVEGVVNAALTEPDTRFFNAVAIGNAVNSQSCRCHKGE